MRRRHFLRITSLSSISSCIAIPNIATGATFKGSPQSALVMDSMGELRPTYSKKLLQEIVQQRLGLWQLSFPLTEHNHFFTEK